jgi:hypothetical protein
MKRALLKREVAQVNDGGKIRKRELIVVDKEAVRDVIAGLKSVEFPRVPAAVAYMEVRIVPGDQQPPPPTN